MTGLALKEVETARRSSVALDAITDARQRWLREQRQPKAITAREALEALHFEATLVWVAAQNIASGVELTAADLDRLTLACSRINVITDEVMR